MAETWVRAVRSDGGGSGEDLFLDGNFVDPAGVVGVSFMTETGQHTFETVENLVPTWRAIATVGQPAGNSEDRPVIVTLHRV
ncbi:MAG TPA: hypothetical protein VET89_00325 [Stellaceae bacterium]|nr:hypothetical protein [Stellaceae bacterium]